MKKREDRIVLSLYVFTMAVFLLNLLALPALPFLLSLRCNFLTRSQSVLSFLPLDASAMRGYLVSLCFYFSCGVCSAVFLWQGRGLLSNLAHHRPFVRENALYMSRASVCLYIVSGLALVRTVIWLTYMSLAEVLLAYNTLFVPVFFVGGLLLRILSGLFSEASEIREENDLTI